MSWYRARQFGAVWLLACSVVAVVGSACTYTPRPPQIVCIDGYRFGVDHYSDSNDANRSFYPILVNGHLTTCAPQPPAPVRPT